MDTTMKFKVQLIVEGEKWPYVGNAYRNKNGSISLVLDEGVSLVGGQRLYLRAARNQEKAPSAPQPDSEA